MREIRRRMVNGGETGKARTVRCEPNNFDAAYYAERTDRNIGWITADEQEIVRRSVLGIAGCGGMGGRLAEIFLRLGVGELRLADSETFDPSNINRQFAATRSSVGHSKATETIRQLRKITDDTMLVAYPDGIAEETVGAFVAGCDIICDEIEFWCVGARIMLHRAARDKNIPVFLANTVGFGSHVFLFTGRSRTMEECLAISFEEAIILERKIRDRQATEQEIVRVMHAVTRSLFPEWPEYCAAASPVKNKPFTRDRLVREGRGAIIATNPSLAAGFLADRVLLRLLSGSSVVREIVEMPEAPGYLYLDAARMQARVIP